MVPRAEKVAVEMERSPWVRGLHEQGVWEKGDLA